MALLTPAPEPFPAVDDFTAILPGDAVMLRGKGVVVSDLVSPDQAVVTWQLYEDGIPALQDQSKLVRLAELVPLGRTGSVLST